MVPIRWWSAAAAGVLFLGLCSGVGADTANVKEEFVGRYSMKKNSAAYLTRDGQELAHIVTIADSSGKRQALVHSRQGPGPEVDLIDDRTIAFGKGGRVAYGGLVANKPTLFVDHKPVSFSHSPAPARPLFSSEGQRLAFVAMKENKQEYVVNDGVPGPEFDQVDDSSMEFSSSGDRLAYRARKGKEWCVVVNGVSDSFYSDIPGGPFFAANDSHVVYVARRGKDAMIVTDGLEGQAWTNIHSLRVGPRGCHVAFIAARGKFEALVVDGVQETQYESVRVPKFSEDCSTVAYSASRRGKWFTVIGEREGPEHEGIGGLALSRDGRRNAYCVQTGKRWRVIVDGRAGEEYEAIMQNTPTFSADGSRVAYAAKQGGKWTLIVDGQAVASHDEIRIGWNSLFSPDGKHVAFFALNLGLNSFAVLDGHRGPSYDWFANGGPVFDADGAIHYLAVRNDSLLRVVQSPTAR